MLPRTWHCCRHCCVSAWRCKASGQLGKVQLAQTCREPCSSVITVLFCSITYVFVKISCATRSNVDIKTSLLRDGIYYNISLYTIQVVDLNFSQACLPFDKISVQWVLKMLQGSVFSWVASCLKHSVAVWRKLKQKITRQFYPNIFFATLSIQLTYFSVECRKLWIFLEVKCRLCFSNS